jgi:protein TonB
MRSASLQQSSYLDRTPLPSRVTAFFLSLAVSVLIVIMLLKLGALPPRVTEPESRLVTVQLLPEAGTPHPRAPARAVAKVKRASRRVPPPLPPPPTPPLNMVILSREDFAAADIARLPSQTAGVAGDAGAGSDSGSGTGSGQGPGGERLYNAEWYREPTHAELATYLPAGRMQAEWGMIACRTVEKYHVEDCHELAEAPAGSGLARALRQASWQFLVRPPRIGGRPVIGAWVSIRFDFTHETAK